MKNANDRLPPGAALGLTSLTATFAQSSWETVDAFPPAIGRSMFADSNGNFLNFSNDYTTTNGVSDVSISTDHGLTGQTVCQIPMRLLRLARPSLRVQENKLLSGTAELWVSREVRGHFSFSPGPHAETCASPHSQV